MKTNSDAAVALFLAIKTSKPQRDALSAVARLLLRGDDLDAFEALLSVYEGLEKQRNALAHGLFGVSDAIPDTLPRKGIDDPRRLSQKIRIFAPRRDLTSWAMIAGNTAAGFARHILREWLRANGYLK